MEPSQPYLTRMVEELRSFTESRQDFLNRQRGQEINVTQPPTIR